MHGMKKSTFEVLNDPKTGLKYVLKCEDELTKNHRTNDKEWWTTLPFPIRFSSANAA
jgi:hypothetical protein